jgi:hypothetical protein
MDLAGTRFGRLVARTPTMKGKRVAWVCVCDCGAIVVKAQADLRVGDTTSCGCVKRELRAAKNTTHGASNSAAYSKWRGMWARVRTANTRKNRCYSGVNVCPTWRKFEAFLSDMGEPPEGYSLDRVDNTQGYNKANCRWVPLTQQAKNTRRLRVYNGVHISELARRHGLLPDVVFDRINKLGWPIEKALTTPTRKMKKHASHP